MCRRVHGRFLPQEVLWKVLSLLPVKSLMRFRCVCKSWNSLVVDRTFVKLQLERSSPSILCTLTSHEENKRYVQCYSTENLVKDPSSFLHDFVLPLSYESGYIIGVCNGLVCFRITAGANGFVQHWFQLWNPATRLTSQKLCCHIHSFPHDGIGFGYDDSRDIYKVVAVVVSHIPHETEVLVQCWGDNDSRKVVSWKGFPKLESGIGLHLDGTLNWLAHDKSKQCVIFSFDLRDETYKILLLPDADFQSNICNIGLLRGCLSFSQYNYRTHDLSVWQMKEFGVAESWTQLLSVSEYCVQPLCMSQNGNFLLFDQILGGFNLVKYNRRDNTLDSFPNHGRVTLWNFFDYVQSLVSPY